LLVALIITLHRVVMATPAHGQIMPMAAHNAMTSAPMQERRDCPHPTCPMTICPAVQATIPTPAGITAASLFVAAIAAVLPRFGVAGPTAIVSPDWRRPPRQTLVLFQTFRC
jgi:hypothetical protein